MSSEIYHNWTKKVNNSKIWAKFLKDNEQEINEIWKSQNLIDIRVPSFLNIVLDIKSQNDLLKIQMGLQQIELIENFYVLELTKDYAKIRIKYFGRMEKIKKIFYEKGIELQNENNEWMESCLSCTKFKYCFKFHAKLLIIIFNSGYKSV